MLLFTTPYKISTKNFISFAWNAISTVMKNQINVNKIHQIHLQIFGTSCQATSTKNKSVIWNGNTSITINGVFHQGIKIFFYLDRTEIAINRFQIRHTNLSYKPLTVKPVFNPKKSEMSSIFLTFFCGLLALNPKIITLLVMSSLIWSLFIIIFTI